MGVNTRRPPLPAPTESMDETSGADTEVATNVTSRTDKTHYSIPDDGSPITINTQKHTSRDPLGRHHRQKSQTSLLIEYFEASKTGDKSRARPSVRVKVTPSAHHRKTRSGNDAIQITGIGSDRKPSYTRRISLSGQSLDVPAPPAEGTELSLSSESNVSGNRPPVEIEVLPYLSSDVSTNQRSTRGLQYAQVDSNVSSMPPDSMLDDDGEDHISIDDTRMSGKASHRSRSATREAGAGKLSDKSERYSKPRKSSRSSRDYDDIAAAKERRRRSSKSQRSEEDDLPISGAESSLVSSNLAPSQRSYRSGHSQASHMTNNPKLLEMVEDTIKRMILPEIDALKEDQKTDRNLRNFENSSRHGSSAYNEPDAQSLQRRLSKSSSSPNVITSKPKVVLNRYGDDPGTVLSRGDSERKTPGKSSTRDGHTSRRRSSGSRHSRESSLHEGNTLLTAAALEHHDSQQDLHTRRKNRSKTRENRSRSGSISIGGDGPSDDFDNGKLGKPAVPPLPMASQINESDLTRDSILSDDRYDQDLDDDRPQSRSSIVHTPVRERQREIFDNEDRTKQSPASSRTPTRTPLNKALHIGSKEGSPSSPRSSTDRTTTRTRMAALAAAGATAAAMGINESELIHMNTDGYGETTSPRKVGSPVQSVSSLKKHFEDDDESLVPRGLRPHSVASRSSAGQLRSKHASQASLPSAESSPRMAPSSPLYKRLETKRSRMNDGYDSPAERDPSMQEESFERGGTPSLLDDATEEWFEQQREVNDHYRNSTVSSNNRDSYQTNPYPQDEKRYTAYTEDSLVDKRLDNDGDGRDEKDVHFLGVTPRYVQNSADVESAVASLMDPSIASSNVVSSVDSASRTNASYSDRMAQHVRDNSQDLPPVYNGSTLSQTIPSQDRWAAIKGHARDLSMSAERLHTIGASPRQSPIKESQNEDKGNVLSPGSRPVMAATSVPDVNDPLPDVGHLSRNDSQSDLTTNPSIIKGPLGGDITGKDTWPYTPEPPRSDDGADELESYQGSPRVVNNHGRRDAAAPFVAGAAAGAAISGAFAGAAAQAKGQESREQDRSLPARASQGRFTPDAGSGSRSRPVNAFASPTESPAAFRDEGYATDNRGGSLGARTPRADPPYSKNDLDEYAKVMNAQDADGDSVEDPFDSAPKKRHFSGNSHGMSSPLYDSSTGKGLENIQSKDIVALMDHLTVRDAQRNARDTEILVTLVRSAAEMRQSFDDMRKLIIEQDRLIMQNTDRGAEYTAQKILNGPRPQPTSAPRTPRAQPQPDEDASNKRKGMLQRALRGLTGGKGGKDLAKIEDMLNQILDNVEDLKHQNAMPLHPRASDSYGDDSLDSYERLRTAPDSGYEPEGQAGTSSTPSQSGHFVSMPREKQQFHSGYDGRRGSEHRVSTVMEDDEDELEPHEARVLNHQFEHNERLTTPTQEYPRGREISPNQSAAQYNSASYNNQTPDQQRKHKSSGSSMFGIPKISRWSKTTSSSAAPDPATLDSPQLARPQRPSSEASRSTSTLDQYDNHPQKDRRHQGQAADSRSVRSSQASSMTRTPSPLIPSEASSHHRQNMYYDDGASQADEAELDDQLFDDPKYQAHRNSLLLEHPQPRQGPTGRHQNTLETQARTFDDTSGTNSDLSQRSASDFDPAIWGSTATAGLARHRLTQVEPLSPVSMGSPATARRNSGDDPLVPAQRKPVPSRTTYEPEREADNDWEPQFSNSGFSKNDYYSSPLGSGHLLEPIAEVRYSLETDSGHISPEPQLASAKAVDMRSPMRKITGPRPMGSRSPAAAAQPRLVDNSGTVRRKPLTPSQGSYDSFDSETF